MNEAETANRPTNPGPDNPERRSFFEAVISGLCVLVVAGAYGIFGSYAARFMYPSKDRTKIWLFIRELSRFKVGDSMTYVSPEGANIAVARKADTGDVSDFIALSSTCPHLGCQVHWEGAKDRFFCPCHNGAFDSEGRATLGPPAEANQSLSRYPLKINHGMLFIQVPSIGLASGSRVMKV